jgi:hypothetical protein
LDAPARINARLNQFIRYSNGLTAYAATASRRVAG